MKRLLSACIAFSALSVLAPGPANAKPKVTTSVAQAKAEFSATQGELARVYQTCITSQASTAEGVGALRDAQRLWTVYRDLNARAVQYNETGRIPKDDQYFYTARTIITLNRIKELRALYDCK